MAKWDKVFSGPLKDDNVLHIIGVAGVTDPSLEDSQPEGEKESCQLVKAILRRRCEHNQPQVSARKRFRSHFLDISWTLAYLLQQT